MTQLLLIAHLFLLLFWVRIWVRPVNTFYFNPFLSGTTRFIDSILLFLRPVLMVPDQVAAFLLLAFFCVFKTIFFLRFGEGVVLTYGTIFSFKPQEPYTSLGYQLLYGSLQFALFMVRFWTFHFLVCLLAPPRRLTRAGEAFAFFARPFSLLPFLLQPIVLLALHFGLTVTMIHLHFSPGILLEPLQSTQTPAAELFTHGHPLAILLRLGWLSLMSYGDGLMWLNNALLLFILGSFMAMIFGMKTVMVICSEGVEVLLGRFSRRQTATSGIDFTPMIFFFVVNFIYSPIQAFLFKLITLPLIP